MVAVNSHGLEAKPFPGGRPSDLLSLMNWGVLCRKGNSEPGMETNEPIV
jgi:hypothetical protein